MLLPAVWLGQLLHPLLHMSSLQGFLAPKKQLQGRIFHDLLEHALTPVRTCSVLRLSRWPAITCDIMTLVGLLRAFLSEAKFKDHSLRECNTQILTYRTIYFFSKLNALFCNERKKEHKNTWQKLGLTWRTITLIFALVLAFCCTFSCDVCCCILIA